MGSGPEEWRALALCSRIGGRVCPRPWTGVQPSRPQPSGAQPGSPLGFSTPVICTPICGQMASRRAPGHPSRRGALLSGLCLAIWAGAQGGGSHNAGGPAQSHPWGFQPQNEQLLRHSAHRLGIQARKLIPSHHPFTDLFYNMSKGQN